MSLSNEEAKNILAPIFAEYAAAVEGNDVKKVENFYDVNAVLVETNKSCTFGNKNITEHLTKINEILGKNSATLSNTHYEGTPKMILIESDFELTSEKAGVQTGHFLQIWRDSGDGFKVYHDEFSMN
ncbi:unnamed protein product [Caenorhabditis bovis]|uniref:DUF4440 domain-containing protein n=1 Tax=Caenorhabditis bovis TaxID=2654633 RepID=A0A8S1FAY0_9PELO|nr:unnamed protein product [Caenorhabditis bovis]